MSATSREGTGTHQLQAILPEWCALSWQNALVCLTFVILFLHLCYLPVPTGQIWHEIVSGQAIAENGIASPPPSLAYSEGVRTLTTNWLGQSFVYWTYHLGGPEGLSSLFALIQLATLAIWGFVFQRITGSSLAALLVAPIVIASSIDVNALGSSTLGLFVFALIALTMANTFNSTERETGPSQFSWKSASLRQWIIVVGLFMVWANLDVSVLIGVGLLGTFALSRLVGVLVKRDLAVRNLFVRDIASTHGVGIVAGHFLVVKQPHRPSIWRMGSGNDRQLAGRLDRHRLAWLDRRVAKGQFDSVLEYRSRNSDDDFRCVLCNYDVLSGDHTSPQSPSQGCDGQQRNSTSKRFQFQRLQA